MRKVSPLPYPPAHARLGAREQTMDVVRGSATLNLHVEAILRSEREIGRQLC
jgi:hypothetical protein